MEDCDLSIGMRSASKLVVRRPLFLGAKISIQSGMRPATSCIARICHLHIQTVPAGLIGCLFLILILEFVGSLSATMPSQKPNDRLNLSWFATNQAANGPDARSEILCFGDSLIKLGILPSVLNDHLGCSAYNLAILGGQAPPSYFLLRRILEQGHRPHAIIIGFSPLLLGMDPRVNLEWWLRRTEWTERAQVLWKACDPALTVSIVLQSCIPTWSSRDSVRSLLGLASDRENSASYALTPGEVQAFERNWRINYGAQVAPREFVPIEGALPKPYVGSRWKWRPHPVHAFYVDRFLQLSAMYGIPTYWVLTPAVSNWLDRNDQAGTISAYRQFVRDQLDVFAGLVILDAQQLAWDQTAFRDPIHLNRQGAVLLSLSVSCAVKECNGLAGEFQRWIKLDNNSGRCANRFDDLLEDLDQSRVAVNPGSNRPG